MEWGAEGVSLLDGTVEQNFARKAWRWRWAVGLMKADGHDHILGQEGMELYDYERRIGRCELRERTLLQPSKEPFSRWSDGEQSQVCLRQLFASERASDPYI